MTALGKTAEILRGLGGALGWSCPSDPRRVIPPPAGEGICMIQARGRRYPDSRTLYDNTCYLEGRDACVVGSARVHYQSETRARWGRGRGLALV